MSQTHQDGIELSNCQRSKTTPAISKPNQKTNTSLELSEKRFYNQRIDHPVDTHGGGVAEDELNNVVHCPNPVSHQGFGQFNTASTLKSSGSAKICEYCGKRFSHTGHLNFHKRRHLGVLPYACNFCDRRFVAHSHLTTHERTHTGNRPLVCKFCGQTFSHPYSLTRHKRLHTGERPYVCKVCDRSFIQSSCLKKHLKTHPNP